VVRHDSDFVKDKCRPEVCLRDGIYQARERGSSLRYVSARARLFFALCICWIPVSVYLTFLALYTLIAFNDTWETIHYFIIQYKFADNGLPWPIK